MFNSLSIAVIHKGFSEANDHQRSGNENTVSNPLSVELILIKPVCSSRVHPCRKCSAASGRAIDRWKEFIARQMNHAHLLLSKEAKRAKNSAGPTERFR